jgi:hypothetical protein
VTFQMQPSLYVRVGGRNGTTYRWESFDVPKVDFTKSDGSKGIHWEVWCTFAQDTTGERIRMRLQDENWEKI